MKRTFLILLILSLFRDLSVAQNKTIDSLSLVLKIAKADTTRINILNALSVEFLNISKYETAINYSNQVIALSDKLLSINNNFSIVSLQKGAAYNTIGIINWYKGHNALALEFTFKGLKIFEHFNDQQKMAFCYNNLGLIYTEIGDYASALEFYFKSLKLFDKVSNKEGMSASYNNIGNIYKLEGNYTKSLEFYFKDLKITEELNNQQGMAYSYGNIGIIYWYKSEYSSALKFYLKAFKILEEIGDKHGIAALCISIGLIHSKQGDYSNALECYLKSLKISEELGEKDGMANACHNIGTLNIGLRKFAEARTYFDKGLSLAKETGSKERIKNTYQSLSELDSTLAEWKGAYQYYKLYTQIKDSIFNEESNKQMTEMSTKYETEKKESQIKLQQTELGKRQEEIKRQNTQRNAFIAGFGLMIALAGVSYRSYRNKRKAHDVITHQKKLVEEKQREILDSINYAQRIQNAILATEEDILNAFPESFLLYKPKDIVAGDFYFFERTSTHIFYAAADCTGHGVPGALVSVICSNALTRCVKEFNLTEPGKILDKARELVLETFKKSGQEVKDGMDISLCAFPIKPGANENVMFQWAGANNPLWYLTSTNEMKEIKADKQPIGYSESLKPFTTHTIELRTGNVVYIFTDGYPDQFGGEKGKKFKYSKLKELLLSIQVKSMYEQKQIINEVFDEWKGDLEQVDDVCIIGIRI